MKPHHFESPPLLAGVSNRHGYGNSLDRCHVNRSSKCIENDAVTNETAFVKMLPLFRPLKEVVSVTSSNISVTNSDWKLIQP